MQYVKASWSRFRLFVAIPMSGDPYRRHVPFSHQFLSPFLIVNFLIFSVTLTWSQLGRWVSTLGAGGLLDVVWRTSATTAQSVRLITALSKTWCTFGLQIVKRLLLYYSHIWITTELDFSSKTILAHCLFHWIDPKTLKSEIIIEFFHIHVWR